MGMPTAEIAIASFRMVTHGVYQEASGLRVRFEGGASVPGTWPGTIGASDDEIVSVTEAEQSPATLAAGPDPRLRRN